MISDHVTQLKYIKTENSYIELLQYFQYNFTVF